MPWHPLAWAREVRSAWKAFAVVSLSVPRRTPGGGPGIRASEKLSPLRKLFPGDPVVEADRGHGELSMVRLAVSGMRYLVALPCVTRVGVPCVICTEMAAAEPKGPGSRTGLTGTPM